MVESDSTEATMGSKQLAQLAGRVNRHLEVAKQDSKAMHEMLSQPGDNRKAAEKHCKSVRQHIEAARKAARELERVRLGR